MHCFFFGKKTIFVIFYEFLEQIKKNKVKNENVNFDHFPSSRHIRMFAFKVSFIVETESALRWNRSVVIVIVVRIVV